MIAKRSALVTHDVICVSRCFCSPLGSSASPQRGELERGAAGPYASTHVACMPAGEASHCLANTADREHSRPVISSRRQQRRQVSGLDIIASLREKKRLSGESCNVWLVALCRAMRRPCAQAISGNAKPGTSAELDLRQTFKTAESAAARELVAMRRID